VPLPIELPEKNLWFWFLDIHPFSSAESVHVLQRAQVKTSKEVIKLFTEAVSLKPMSECKTESSRLGNNESAVP